MPFKSQAQRRLFYAAANKKGGVDDLSQSTAKKFIADSKDSPRKLPERFSKFKSAMKRGGYK